MSESAQEGSGSDPYRYDPTPELEEMFEGRRKPADNRRTSHLRAWGGPVWAVVAYHGLSPQEALENVEFDAGQNGNEVAFNGLRNVLEGRVADELEREEGRANAGISTRNSI